jgi:outer membrane protein TolC
MKIRNRKIKSTLLPMRSLLTAGFLLVSILGELRAGPPPKGTVEAGKRVVALNLRDYIDRIIAESPRIRATRLDVAAADYEARSAYASYLPHLIGTARVGYINGKRLTGFTGLFEPVGGFNNGQGVPDEESFTQEGPGLLIPVFKDGSFLGINEPPEVRRRRAERDVIKFQGSLTTQDLVFAATEAYLASIKASHLLELRKQHFEVAEQEANRVQTRSKSNLATAEDVAVAVLQRETSRASFQAERGEAVYSFFAVADLLGLEARQLRIQGDYPTPAPLPDFEKVAALISVQHPKVREQEAAVDEARATVALKRSQQYPTVEAQSYDYQYGDFKGNASNQWVSFMAVRVPVFDFGEAAYATSSARLRARAEAQRLLAVRQEVRKELVDAFVQVKQSESGYAKAINDVNEQQRVTARLQEQSGHDQALLQDLNAAKIKLLETKEALEQAHYDLLFQYARVQRLSAGGWEWVQH